jgi:two-component system, OmpR family, sensor histidine kinase KdpD
MPTSGRRPDPDALLARITTAERQRARGRLKIFLGYAAGVGKTFAMLDAAHQRRSEGVDVVVAVAETHGRPETEVRLAGLEVLPRWEIPYRGVTLREMDLDALLARRPALALVDELAHTNAPGARHPKRYQDVEEILSAGIDVYTTLNVQHLESLRDVVAQITGVVVRETVPDRVIDEAAEIELVDLPPDELLQRLSEGKVYVPEQARQALERFFRPGNLTALRELSLRRTAERVDDQMRAYMETRAIPGPWAAAERILVCVGRGPHAERLVRAGRRLADELGAEWQAVYVETPGHVRLDPLEQDRLAANLQLAEALGGRSRILPGRDVARSVIDYGRAQNVTKIVVGKTSPARRQWLLQRTLIDELIDGSGEIDVYVVSAAAEAVPAEWGFLPRLPTSWQPYVLAVGLVAVASLVGEVVQRHVSPPNLVMLFLLAVVVVAVRLGRGPAILAAVLGVAVFDFFFVPPRLTFRVSDTEYLLTFAGLLAVGLVISRLTASLHEQATAAQQREAETATLYSLGRDLAVASTLDDVLMAVQRNVRQALGREVTVLLPESEAESPLRVVAGEPGATVDTHELAVARWAYDHGEPAGRGTDTLSGAAARYVPLVTPRGVIGVLGARPADPRQGLRPEGHRQLDALAGLAALAIERAQLAETARHARLLEETERLQRAVLHAISHDLRTPLVAITGALTSLEADAATLADDTKASLVQTAREESDRLNQLVGNLLEMSRLEAGALTVRPEPVDVEDLAGTALGQLGQRLAGRVVTVVVPPGFPLVRCDYVLILQVLVNLLDNAVKYSPPGSLVQVSAELVDGEVLLKVTDHGPGIPPEDRERVFDMFYRGSGAGAVPGSGLGLAIVRGVVEAHGGRVWAEPGLRGGTVMVVALPASVVEAEATA